jgi:hypothetical protein
MEKGGDDGESNERNPKKLDLADRSQGRDESEQCGEGLKHPGTTPDRIPKLTNSSDHRLGEYHSEQNLVHAVRDRLGTTKIRERFLEPTEDHQNERTEKIEHRDQGPEGNPEGVGAPSSLL